MVFVFFCKQKTAYDMRISDWSSDVCSSDLQTHLIRQLQARSVSREYIALVHGRLTRPGAVKLSIGRDPRVPVRMAVDNPIAPKPAVTHYAPLRVGQADARSEERRVGKECVSTGSSRCSRANKKKKQT